MRCDIKILCGILLLIVLLPFVLLSQSSANDDEIFEEEGFDFGKVIRELFIVPKVTKSYSLLETQCGVAFLNLCDENFVSEFTPCVILNVNYGWTRLTPVDSLITYLGSERAYLLVLSSHLKPPGIKFQGIHLENWQFGFNYKNGWGYNLSNERVLMLYHSSGINFSRMEFEQFGANDFEKFVISDFNRRYKFGSAFESGILFPINVNFSVNLSYTYNIVFQRLEFYKWVGSAGIELIYQRVIDFCAKDIINKFGNNAPILLFILKNGFSYLYYTLKDLKEFFPFNSSTMPMRIQKIRMGLAINF